MIDRYARPKMKGVWSEAHKYTKWLQVELAICEAWAKQGVIPAEDMAKLRKATYDPQHLAEVFERTRHDMTAFLRSVTKELGPEGRWLHLGLTSSDVMDTALALQLVEAANLLDTEMSALLEVLKEKALQHKGTLMMGRTHGVHAEPTSFGLKLVGWWDEMGRQRQRLARACAEIAVGKVSGAVGTHATVPPSVEAGVCASLGLQVEPVSSQVVHRDRHANFVLTLALIATSLEKFATEIRHLQRTEIREVEEPFAEGQTGSSAMPHKRNPELTERICGLARLIRGHAVTALENVPLWHERDISHSSAERLILPDSCMALDYILSLFAEVMRNLRVHPQRMRRNLELTKGLVFSQRVLLALIEKGMGREEAYRLIQSHAMHAWDGDLDFRALLRADQAVTTLLSTKELEGLFDYGYYLRFVDESFQRLGLM
ncbi:MAG: adenylosuccinate lyase [Chloroflexi bacterium]|nr:adenylosuccinate lyase [Chloroflexota bacterium]